MRDVETAQRTDRDAADAEVDSTDAQLREVALTRAEYATICERLGRRPNAVELGMCGAMWSEHCGYKNSRPLLRRFQAVPAGERVLVGAGSVILQGRQVGVGATVAAAACVTRDVAEGVTVGGVPARPLERTAG